MKKMVNEDSDDVEYCEGGKHEDLDLLTYLGDDEKYLDGRDYFEIDDDRLDQEPEVNCN